MEKFIRISILLILFLGLTVVSAQEGITISGVVIDANGSAVAGAIVTIRKPTNDQIQRTTTDTQGQYRFSNLTAGPYIVEVTADKFQFVSKEVIVNAGDAPAVNYRPE
jgi:Carboxypeptidase regulatory-like domain